MSFDCHGSLRVFHEADVIYSQPDVVVFDIALLKLRHPQALSAKQIETPVIASRLKQGIVFTQNWNQMHFMLLLCPHFYRHFRFHWKQQFVL